MKEIQEIVNNQVQTMVDNGTIQKTIEEGISKSITSAIKSQLENYGGITQQIEKSIKEGLSINTNDLPFETYNEQMLVAVKAKLGNFFQNAASNKFMEEMDKLLAPAPKEMSINDFIEKIVKYWKTDESWDASDLDDYASVEFEHRNGRNNSFSLKMWKQKESKFSHSSRTNSEDIHLYIINGKIRINHKQSYNLTCFSEDEAFIFKLYAAGTILTGIDDFDPADCDLTLKETDY